MMSSAKHTPTPWKAFISGNTIEVQPQKGKPIVAWPGFDECDVPLAVHKANARFIVRAVNAHDDLLAILQRWDALFPGEYTGTRQFHEVLDDTRAAIAAAKGKAS